MIIEGQFAAGRRLDEMGLSTQIGASRTPVREALIALEEEGLVLSRPNHGFTVAPLNERLVRELYPILAALEGAAVELAGERLRAVVPRLSEINARLSKETHKGRRYELDREFHRALTCTCDNERLLRLLEQYWNQASRVDGSQARGLANFEGSCAQHASIVAAIERDKFSQAAQLVRTHWHDGQQVVLNWMKDAQ